LIFKFFDSKLEDKRLAPNKSKHSPTLIRWLVFTLSNLNSGEGPLQIQLKVCYTRNYKHVETVLELTSLVNN
jgi:hypothetical protein